ncbi:PASTA domain-containing protein [Candidatus Magnetominusculus xianensis]|uniref:Serine/threonine protein kinase n=1 Tax=Candidatus Magnetominusculus xianensis TaxID=1748249 RepID=A0ABR5SFM6_9BACT|nr:PASTA domain-containing protein [Candidatus Magnetominusculus xianensis]KWT86726.1 serine/threonine protein kinase [Candidatus Magnetominusculus xianensis]MBF0402555.1 PASTA domain-containing protein [Nitrospirota bacterium]
MNTLIRLTIFFVLFIAISVLAGYATFALLTTSKSIEVPDLKSKSLIEANEALNGVKLYLRVEGEDYDHSVPAGHILRQNIPTGNKIKEGRTISVLMSKGPRYQFMGDLRGIPLGKAEDTVAQSKVKINKVIEVHSDTIGPGIVISQRPGPEEKSGNDITLIVSKGTVATTYYCPNFIGKNPGQAEQLAASLGLKIDAAGAEGRITSQSPAPGTIVKQGERIHVVMLAPENQTEQPEQKEQ